jgi:hypothetical protein
MGTRSFTGALALTTILQSRGLAPCHKLECGSTK